MKVEIKVPSMGESITEATVGEIIKKSGEQVETDDEILELETDKVNQVLYAEKEGKLNLKVKPDQVVKIGEVIGHIETEAAKEQVEEKKPEEKKEKKKEEEKSEPENKPAITSEREIRYGKEQFLKDLARPAKGITPEVKEPTPSLYRQETRRRMPKIRQVIAKKLVEAQQNTAMLTTFNELDLSAVIELRNRYKEDFHKRFGAKLGFMSFFVKAVVSALQATPDLNSWIDGDEIVHREYYDLGIAVGTERGLFVPVLRDCDRLSFAEIEGQIESYAKKAREGKITVEDLQGGGFTITNGGVYGSLLSTPILNPPQSGILGMHKIQKRPVVVDDQIVIRSMMYLALSYDHRIVDGKEAVTFLVHIKNVLEDPSRLLLEV